MTGWWRCPPWCTEDHKDVGDQSALAHHLGKSVAAGLGIPGDWSTTLWVKPMWTERKRRNSLDIPELPEVFIFDERCGDPSGRVAVPAYKAARFADLLDSLGQPEAAVAVRQVAEAIENDGVTP